MPAAALEYIRTVHWDAQTWNGWAGRVCLRRARMMHDEIKAVLFDLGETILEFGRVNKTRVFLAGARSTHAFLKDQGQPVSGFAWYFLRNLVRLRMRYLISNLTRRDFDSFEVLQRVGARLGVRLSQEQWEQFAWLWYEPLGRLAKVEEDLVQTLDTLMNRMGLRLGIVSNTFVGRASLERQLQELGLLDFFSVQLYSYEFHFRKPSPEIFRIAAARIQEPPERVLFVGDRIDNDIRPALHCGMKAVLKEAYTNDGKTLPPGALRIRRLAELPALIGQINASRAAASLTQA
jgi:HAD superfamily hydrolase (TIGR01549 family)